MNGMLKLLLLSLAALIALAAVDYFVMPPTAPIGLGDNPQPLWQVEAAFLLRTLENVTAMVVAVIILLAAALYIRRRLRPDTQF